MSGSICKKLVGPGEIPKGTIFSGRATLSEPRADSKFKVFDMGDNKYILLCADDGTKKVYQINLGLFDRKDPINGQLLLIGFGSVLIKQALEKHSALDIVAVKEVSTQGKTTGTAYFLPGEQIPAMQVSVLFAPNGRMMYGTD